MLRRTEEVEQDDCRSSDRDVHIAARDEHGQPPSIEIWNPPAMYLLVDPPARCGVRDKHLRNNRSKARKFEGCEKNASNPERTMPAQ